MAFWTLMSHPLCAWDCKAVICDDILTVMATLIQTHRDIWEAVSENLWQSPSKDIVLVSFPLLYLVSSVSVCHWSLCPVSSFFYHSWIIFAYAQQNTGSAGAFLGPNSCPFDARHRLHPDTAFYPYFCDHGSLEPMVQIVRGVASAKECCAVKSGQSKLHYEQ